jgi:hypothetical protein
MQTDLLLRVKERRGLTDKEKEAKAKLDQAFETYYQRWYTDAHALIRQLSPQRLTEFEAIYQGDGKRKKIDLQTYNIQDWMMGLRAREDEDGNAPFSDLDIVSMRLQMQVQLVEAVEGRFESSLHDIRQLVQADLFDSELDASRELLKKGFERAAGAVAGVVLEKHLAQVADNHAIAVQKKNPSINDFNELLKAKGTIDIPVWRNIQRLADLRNLCDHNKDREPSKDEIRELIDGTDKVTKTLF